MFSGLYSAVASSLMGAKDTTLISVLPGNSTRLIIYKNSGVLDLGQTLRLRFHTEVREFFLQISRLGLGPSQPLILWVPEVRVRELKQPGCKADHPPHLVLSIRNSGSLPLLTLCVWYGVCRNSFYLWGLAVT